MCVKQLSQLMPAKIKNAVGYKLWTNVMLTGRKCETQLSTPSAESCFNAHMWQLHARSCTTSFTTIESARSWSYGTR